MAVDPESCAPQCKYCGVTSLRQGRLSDRVDSQVVVTCDIVEVDIVKPLVEQYNMMQKVLYSYMAARTPQEVAAERAAAKLRAEAEAEAEQI